MRPVTLFSNITINNRVLSLVYTTEGYDFMKMIPKIIRESEVVDYFIKKIKIAYYMGKGYQYPLTILDHIKFINNNKLKDFEQNKRVSKEEIICSNILYQPPKCNKKGYLLPFKNA